jgi:DNA-binding response OmpR family regulator
VRVLVVDDCRRLADLVAEGLSDQGITADVAYDGYEAAAKLEVNTFDVVVLDRTLPGIPGDTLCQMITGRQMATGCQTTAGCETTTGCEPVAGDERRSMVLMLSGAESPCERAEGLRLGADDYLAKPFHLPELALRVRALARRRAVARPPVLRAGGVELDCSRLSARRDGHALKLSPKEFAVLEALVCASPGYLSAEDLLEKVWDENADPFTKTVTVTIGRLRRKLGHPPLIETVPMVGHCIPH